jgi:hypothetical protein
MRRMRAGKYASEVEWRAETERAIIILESFVGRARHRPRDGRTIHGAASQRAGRESEIKAENQSQKNGAKRGEEGRGDE